MLALRLMVRAFSWEMGYVDLNVLKLRWELDPGFSSPWENTLSTGLLNHQVSSNAILKEGPAAALCEGSGVHSRTPLGCRSLRGFRGS